MAKVTMDQWITEVVNDKSKDGSITAIACFHREGSREQEVYAAKFIEGEKVDAIGLANVFMRKAQTHVQDIAGFQSFYLKAFYAGRQEYQARLPFQIENSNEVSYGSSEPPTEEGRRQQGMRHGEAAFQIWVVQATNLANIQNSLIRQLSEDRTKLLSENMDAVGALKEIAFQIATRNHEFEMEKMRFQRETRMYETAAKLGPSLLNAVTGKEIIPQTVADSNLIESIIESLTPEQIQKFQTLGLPEEVMAAIATRAADHLKKKYAAEQMAMEAVKDRQDPVFEVMEGGKK